MKLVNFVKLSEVGTYGHRSKKGRASDLVQGKFGFLASGQFKCLSREFMDTESMFTILLTV
jgi:hypothetical protein